METTPPIVLDARRIRRHALTGLVVAVAVVCAGVAMPLPLAASMPLDVGLVLVLTRALGLVLVLGWTADRLLGWARWTGPVLAAWREAEADRERERRVARLGGVERDQHPTVVAIQRMVARIEGIASDEPELCRALKRVRRRANALERERRALLSLPLEGAELDAVREEVDASLSALAEGTVRVYRNVVRRLSTDGVEGLDEALRRLEAHDEVASRGQHLRALPLG